MEKLAILWVLAITAVAEDVFVDVPGYATVQGKTGRSYVKDNLFYSFKGVRYAKAPTAERRFQPPLPVDPLPEGEIYDATQSGRLCHQLGILGNEDCLFMDIFTRQLPNATNPNPNLPVMVFILGGGFVFGFTFVYSPFAFMDQECILINVQFRVGPLGFLSLDNEEVPGNAGLYDIVESLRWIKQNIAAFGGNPDDVTLFGESSGGVTVGLLLLAPPARGLFKNAIAESGNGLSYWSCDSDPIPDSLGVAAIAGCPTEPLNETVACLKTIDPDVLTKAYTTYANNELVNGRSIFGGSLPSVQRNSANPLIPDEPRVLMESGNFLTDVNVIFGSNKHDGSLLFAGLYDGYLLPNDKINDTEFLQRECFYTIYSLTFGYRPSDEEVDGIISKYFNGLELGNFTSMVPGFVDWLGVTSFKQGALDSARYFSRYNPKTYVYSFTYRGQFSLFSFIYGDHPYIPGGVAHGDELIYLFQILEGVFDDNDKLMTERLTHLWTTFATYGDPTPDGVEFPGIPKWLPFDEATQTYYDLGLEFSTKENFEGTFTVSVDEGYIPE